MSNSPYLLLVETSVITQTDANTWKAIAKLGECLLPEVVALEIKNIANGKAEGNESAAKQFQNLSQLNWQTTSLTAKHADLVIRTTQNLSRKAKLMINVAQSAVGVAKAYPNKCVVLISDEISLRDRIAKLDHKNLCAIPSAIARQWSRTDQAPPIVKDAVIQLLEKLEQTALQSSQQINTTNLINEKSSISDLKADNPVSSQKASSKNSLNYRHIAISLVKYGLMTTFLATILLFGWRFIQPQQFQQFWKKTGLSPLPKILIDNNQPKNKLIPSK
jgi:hypothetical protein